MKDNDPRKILDQEPRIIRVNNPLKIMVLLPLGSPDEPKTLCIGYEGEPYKYLRMEGKTIVFQELTCAERAQLAKNISRKG